MTPAPITETTCTLHPLGFDVRVLMAGEGPVVLMLHGNPDCADEWRNAIARLSDRFRCIAPDFPGYGKSPQVPASFAYDRAAHVAFVDALLNAVQASDPIIVIVHDIGGFAGIPWADANLERVRGLVITNTVAYEGFDWFYPPTLWGDSSPLGRARARLAMFAIGLNHGALFRKGFANQSPQLSASEIDRVTHHFATNRHAKNATIWQFVNRRPHV